MCFSVFYNSIAMETFIFLDVAREAIAFSLPKSTTGHLKFAY